MLNIDAPTLDGLLSGTMDWPPEAWRWFQDALDNLSAAGYPVRSMTRWPQKMGMPKGRGRNRAAGWRRPATTMPI